MNEHGISLFQIELRAQLHLYMQNVLHLHNVDFFTDSTYQPMNLDGANYHRQGTEIRPESREQTGRKKWFEGRVQKRFVHNPKG